VKDIFGPSLPSPSDLEVFPSLLKKRGKMLGSSGAQVLFGEQGLMSCELSSETGTPWRGSDVCTSSSDAILVFDFSNAQSSLESGREKPFEQQPRLEAGLCGSPPWPGIPSLGLGGWGVEFQV
jgi:hypothetical protein